MVVVVVKCLKCGHTATLKLKNVGNAAKVKCTKCVAAISAAKDKSNGT